MFPHINILCRDAVFQNDMMGPLADLLDDPVDACRRNVHQALNRMAEYPSGDVSLDKMYS